MVYRLIVLLFSLFLYVIRILFFIFFRITFLDSAFCCNRPLFELKSENVSLRALIKCCQRILLSLLNLFYFQIKHENCVIYQISKIST